MKRKYEVKTKLKKAPAIYKIYCTETDKVYIGESVDVSQRISKHFYLLREGIHSNPILQNMFKKYGEETFIVDIIKFTETSDELELKKLERKYQLECPTCISLDSNEIFVVERSEEWRLERTQQLNNIREKGLELWRIPIIVYNIVDKSYTEFKQLTDAEELMEQKHIYKNIKDKILTPYKNKYVAFKKEEFTKENISKILLIDEDSSYCYVTNVCDLYCLLENKEYHFSSKRQFSLFFSKSANTQLYDKYLNEKIIDFEFRCVIPIKTKQDLFSLNINPRKRLSKTKCNVKIFYEALLYSKSNNEIVERTGINRSTIIDIFNERSKEEWLILLDRTITRLPD